MTNDATLKLRLAGMLSEVVTFVTYPSDRATLFYWKDLRDVRDTELDYLVRLAEAKLDPDEWPEYGDWLRKQAHASGYPEWHATWQQRTLALCKTKGIEV